MCICHLSISKFMSRIVNIEEKMVTKSAAVHFMYWDNLWSSIQGKFNLEETLVPFPILVPSQPFWHL